MRYVELTEAIANRPRQLGLYIKNRIKQIDGWLRVIEQAEATIKANTRDGESMLSACLRYAIDDEDQKDAARALYRVLGNTLGRYQLSELREALQNYLTYGHDFLRYVMHWLQYAEKVSAAEHAIFAILPYAERGFAEYGFRPGHPDDEADPEFIAAKTLLVALRKEAALIPTIERTLDDLRSKLGVLIDIRNSHYSRDGYRPQHEEVETLYHATAFVTEILRDGFSAEKPVGRRGLGNFGEQPKISFTHDLEIARNIMRTLKEMWMIAHGKLTAETILQWADAEGLADAIRKSWHGLTSKPLPVGRNADPRQVVLLYRYWLGHTKLRTDPVMTYPDETIEMLMGRDIKDIGVLACDVRLQSDDEYMVGESEFRVAADHVQSIKQVL